LDPACPLHPVQRQHGGSSRSTCVRITRNKWFAYKSSPSTRCAVALRRPRLLNLAISRPVVVTQESDTIYPTGFAGGQPSMMSVNQGVQSEVGTEQHRPTVASSRQRSASNRRRKNTIPGRFICHLCPQDFTANHNLKSQSSIGFHFY